MENDGKPKKRGGVVAKLRLLFDGLGTEWLRDNVKSALSWAVGLALLWLASLFGDFTWNLRSFNLFGATNTVEAAGEKIADDSVYRMPFDTRVRLKGDVFLSITRKYNRGGIYATLTNAAGQDRSREITTSDSTYMDSGCDRIGVHLMQAPERDSPDALILYTRDRIDSDDCRGFW